MKNPKYRYCDQISYCVPGFSIHHLLPCIAGLIRNKNVLKEVFNKKDFFILPLKSQLFFDTKTNELFCEILRKLGFPVYFSSEIGLSEINKEVDWLPRVSAIRFDVSQLSGTVHLLTTLMLVRHLFEGLFYSINLVPQLLKKIDEFKSNDEIWNFIIKSTTRHANNHAILSLYSPKLPKSGQSNLNNFLALIKKYGREPYVMKTIENCVIESCV